jgi:hypothetical protein
MQSSFRTAGQAAFINEFVEKCRGSERKSSPNSYEVNEIRDGDRGLVKRS